MADSGEVLNVGGSGKRVRQSHQRSLRSPKDKKAARDDLIRLAMGSETEEFEEEISDIVSSMIMERYSAMPGILEVREDKKNKFSSAAEVFEAVTSAVPPIVRPQMKVMAAQMKAASKQKNAKRLQHLLDDDFNQYLPDTAKKSKILIDAATVSLERAKGLDTQITKDEKAVKGLRKKITQHAKGAAAPAADEILRQRKKLQAAEEELKKNQDSQGERALPRVILYQDDKYSYNKKNGKWFSSDNKKVLDSLNVKIIHETNKLFMAITDKDEKAIKEAIDNGADVNAVRKVKIPNVLAGLKSIIDEVDRQEGRIDGYSDHESDTKSVDGKDGDKDGKLVEYKATPLTMACILDMPKTVGSLMRRGANPNYTSLFKIPDYPEFTMGPIQASILNVESRCFNVLCKNSKSVGQEQKIDFGFTDEENMGIAVLAILARNFDALKKLRQIGELDVRSFIDAGYYTSSAVDFMAFVGLQEEQIIKLMDNNIISVDHMLGSERGPDELYSNLSAAVENGFTDVTGRICKHINEVEMSSKLPGGAPALPEQDPRLQRLKQQKLNEILAKAVEHENRAGLSRALLDIGAAPFSTDPDQPAPAYDRLTDLLGSNCIGSDKRSLQVVQAQFYYASEDLQKDLQDRKKAPEVTFTKAQLILAERQFYNKIDSRKGVRGGVRQIEAAIERNRKVMQSIQQAVAENGFVLEGINDKVDKIQGDIESFGKGLATFYEGVGEFHESMRPMLRQIEDNEAAKKERIDIRGDEYKREYYVVFQQLMNAFFTTALTGKMKKGWLEKTVVGVLKHIPGPIASDVAKCVAGVISFVADLNRETQVKRVNNYSTDPQSFAELMEESARKICLDPANGRKGQGEAIKKISEEGISLSQQGTDFIKGVLPEMAENPPASVSGAFKKAWGWIKGKIRAKITDSEPSDPAMDAVRRLVLKDAKAVMLAISNGKDSIRAIDADPDKERNNRSDAILDLIADRHKKIVDQYERAANVATNAANVAMAALPPALAVMQPSAAAAPPPPGASGADGADSWKKKMKQVFANTLSRPVKSWTGHIKKTGITRSSSIATLFALRFAEEGVWADNIRLLGALQESEVGVNIIGQNSDKHKAVVKIDEPAISHVETFLKDYGSNRLQVRNFSV